MIERHESYRGRTTPEIEWRVWNPEHTSYVAFKTKKEAKAYDDAWIDALVKRTTEA